jgi:beta-lactamase regulating signal transducer with metallopeptidase domain
MSVERLLNCLVEGMVIALFAWLLLRLIGRRNSGTRFAVWFCALLAIAIAPFVETSSPATMVSHPVSAAFTMPRSWTLYLFGAWAAIATVGLARVAAGLWHLRAIRRGSTTVDLREVDALVTRTLEEFQPVRRVELLSSQTLRVPTAIGFLKPAVVVPAWSFNELSPEELKAVMLHELAHLRRWDDWTNLAQKILRALFFFHPAVWWVESQLSLEREMACDDLVLAKTANPQAYAECLVRLAEKNFLQRGIALAQAAVGRMRQTSLRVLQILDARRPKAVAVWQPAPWVVAGFSVVCLASAAHAPRLVGFNDPTMVKSRAAAMASFADGAPIYASAVPASFVARENGGGLLNRKAASNSPSMSRGSRALRSAARARRDSYAGRADGSASAHAAPTVIPAKRRTLEQQPANTVRLARAAAPQGTPFVVMQQAVFVILQDQPGGDVPVLWRVSIWRFTVLPQPARQVAPGVSSKST